VQPCPSNSATSSRATDTRRCGPASLRVVDAVRRVSVISCAAVSPGTTAARRGEASSGKARRHGLPPLAPAAGRWVGVRVEGVRVCCCWVMWAGCWAILMGYSCLKKSWFPDCPSLIG
jgi:hypothetical protein